MKINQEAVWEKIAPKWNELKNVPFLAVKGFLEGKKGKILDLGCGSGRNFPYFPKGSEIYAVDFSARMLKYAEEKGRKYGFEIESFKSDSVKLPFEDSSFDYGICIAVLHCIETEKKRKKTLEEFCRVLKSGGEGLVSVWGRNSLRVKNRPKETYVPWTSVGVEKRYTYLYDPGELEKDLEDVGFEIVKSWEEKNINVIVRKP